jgi:DNA-binding response OmpR family regulator
MKILLIEDDHRLSQTLGDYFEYIEGWEIVRAYRPAQALRELSERLVEIDVIVLDIMMPPDQAIDDKKSDYGQDTGILLLEKLELVAGGRVPVVVLSARQDLGWLKEQGRVKEYLQKTLTPEEIGEGIRQSLRDLPSTSQEGR